VAHVVSLGEIIVPGTPKLAAWEVHSFFWAAMDTVKPNDRVAVISRMSASKAPIRFVVEGLNVDLLALIKEFEWDVRAGEEEDVYYTLRFSEYLFYGARTVEVKAAKDGAVFLEQCPPPRVDNSPPAPQTYTVLKGDSLWAITRKLGGDSWQSLYALPENKGIIGNNPNIIKPGQTLKIPEGWTA
jgi:nucleoid-associated protein YgaU